MSDYYVGRASEYARQVRAALRTEATSPPPLPEVPLPPSPRPTHDEIKQAKLVAVQRAAQDHTDVVRRATLTAAGTEARHRAVSEVLVAGARLETHIKAALNAGLTPTQIVDGAHALHPLYVEDLLNPLC